MTPRGADRAENGAEAAEAFAFERGRAFAPRHPRCDFFAPTNPRPINTNLGPSGGRHPTCSASSTTTWAEMLSYSLPTTRPCSLRFAPTSMPTSRSPVASIDGQH